MNQNNNQRVRLAKVRVRLFFLPSLSHKTPLFDYDKQTEETTSQRIEEETMPEKSVVEPEKEKEKVPKRLAKKQNFFQSKKKVPLLARFRNLKQSTLPSFQRARLLRIADAFNFGFHLKTLLIYHCDSNNNNKNNQSNNP